MKVTKSLRAGNCVNSKRKFKILKTFLPPSLWNTRWFKYDRDKLWPVYTQSVPVIFEPLCNCIKRCTRNSMFRRSSLRPPEKMIEFSWNFGLLLKMVCSSKGLRHLKLLYSRVSCYCEDQCHCRVMHACGEDQCHCRVMHACETWWDKHWILCKTHGIHKTCYKIWSKRESAFSWDEDDISASYCCSESVYSNRYIIRYACFSRQCCVKCPKLLSFYFVVSDNNSLALDAMYLEKR
jgi:hypothetical protein